MTFVDPRRILGRVRSGGSISGMEPLQRVTGGGSREGEAMRLSQMGEWLWSRVVVSAKDSRTRDEVLGVKS